MRFLFAAALAAIMAIATAEIGYRYTGMDYVGFSCKRALAMTAKFCSYDEARSYKCYCLQPNAIGSFFTCTNEHLKSKKDRRDMEAFFQFRCPNVTVEEMRSITANVSTRLVNTSLIQPFNMSEPVSFPVYANHTAYKIAFNTYYTRYTQFTLGNHMGAGLVGYWGIIMMFGTVTNLFCKFAPNLALSLNRKASQMAFVRWYRKHVSLPATFRSKHTTRNFVEGMIPTRLESIIVFGFVVLCVLFHAVNFHAVEHNVIFASKAQELSRYVGDRSALLANYLMTITFLLAGRSQLFISLTGWKQSTFMMYHKWVARMLLGSVFVHTIAMFVHCLVRKVYKYWILEEWWRYGAVAAVAGGVIFVQSFSWLREWSYELFLYVHIATAVAFLVGAWKHLAYFSYTEWAYATAAVWCFDRFLRLVRISMFGIKTAKVSIVSDETLVITVNKGSWWHFFPGAFGYLHILKWNVFWQSHPFTVVRTDNNELRFFIKIKRGATKKLYNELLKEPNHESEIKVALEGPYGDKKPVEAYDQVLLYSGGNGIPGPFAYAKELGETSKEAKSKFVKLYWVIRHWDSLDWFLDELMLLQKFSNVQTIIYVTRADDGKVGKKLAHHFDQGESESSEGEKDSNVVAITVADYMETIQKALPHIEFRKGRPDIAALVEQDIDECQNQNAAIITCGHNEMCDKIRQTVAVKVGDHRSGRIDFFEELQTW
ncbi:LAQU0S19e01134g1_1 [Lachancea quebecensis]|uniref:ferric-chelate reductase (NADPH) n=1 Tax=Lachancea quebecensis TaxID=1654605 RepID=A0A0N7MMD1_9SACH|nr:LAQU0S19e01134g1_1 [Lachancea quebecensis]